MGDSYQRLYDAVERNFSVDSLNASDIFDWLTKRSSGKIKDGFDKSGKQRFTDSEATPAGQSKLRGIAESIAEIKRINTQAKSIDNADQLADLKKELRSYPNNYPHKKEVQTLIEDKIKQVNIRIIEQQKAVEREIEQEERKIEREAERIDRKIEIADLSTEEKRGLLAGNEDERRSAIRALRQLSPQSLGGFRRAEIQKGISALADFDKVF